MTEDHRPATVAEALRIEAALVENSLKNPAALGFRLSKLAEQAERDCSITAELTSKVEAIPFDDDVRNILGRPCFTLIGVANLLRKAGHKIPPKAEEEQAACLHWMLNLYLKHGANWGKEGEAELKAAAANG